jgi:hypothetical protein
METKFIEGTNEQYSIREDGTVIRNYKMMYDINLKKVIPKYKTVIRKLSINKKLNAVILHVTVNKIRKVFYVRQIVATHFNLHNPFVNKGPCVTIGHKDNNPLNCSLDNLYYKGRIGITLFTSVEEKIKNKKKINNLSSKKLYANASYEKKQRIIKRIKTWSKNNPNKVKINRKIANKNTIEKLQKSYVAAKLKIPVNELFDDLYIHQKKVMSFKRKLAKDHQVPIQKIV